MADAGPVTPDKSGRTKSCKAWEHFTQDPSNKVVVCKICKASLAWHGSTTVMNEHLRRKHVGITVEEGITLKKQRSISEFVHVNPQCTPAQASVLTDSVLKMLVTDMRPLSMVEDKGFQSMVSALNPLYKLPSRTHFTTLMERKYRETFQHVTDTIHHNESRIALTADIWTSVATETYLGITCHYIGDDWKMNSICLTTMPLEERHTAAHIADWLEEVLERSKIPTKKIIAHVHNNAANMVAFECATVFMSGQEYPSLSSLPAIVKGLLRSTERASFETAAMRSFQATVKDQLHSRWHDILSEQVLNPVIISAALDPRFRKLKFLTPEQIINVQTELLALRRSEILEEQQETSTSTFTADAQPGPSASRTSILESLLESGGSSEEDTEGQPMEEDIVRNEVQSYFAEKPLHNDGNPLSWWKSNEDSKNDGSHRHSCERVISGSKNSQKWCTQESISELIEVLEKDAKNLKAVSEFVQKHYNKLIKLTNSYLYLCDLNGTIYMGQKYMKEGWEESYLPEITRMEVFGTLEVDSEDVSPCPSEQWVILVGEDGCVYAYWNEELLLIAKSLGEFVKNGKRKVYASYLYPGSSNEDDKSTQPSEEIQKIQQRTRRFVNSTADDFKKFLAKIESQQLRDRHKTPILETIPTFC